MTDFLAFFFLGGILSALFYFVLYRPLQQRIDILQKLLSIAIAQREEALAGKDRARIQQVYRQGMKHYGLKDRPRAASDDVLSGRTPAPVTEDW